MKNCGCASCEWLQTNTVKRDKLIKRMIKENPHMEIDLLILDHWFAETEKKHLKCQRKTI